ncbi:hypothetical protein EWM63_25770 [Pseudoduganella lutea]|uniref:Uncharacterized protein n=1 Tax=Pseudoduganella lutea TaxID=321985 RepID=A0A4P6L554_9BURK|nr:hypothetical protein EWM63_25770 [Pseudoduganella lutea]
MAPTAVEAAKSPRQGPGRLLPVARHPSPAARCPLPAARCLPCPVLHHAPAAGRGRKGPSIYRWLGAQRGRLVCYRNASPTPRGYAAMP